MTKLLLLIFALTGVPAQAQSQGVNTIRLGRSLVVYKRPDFRSGVAFTVPSGSVIAVSRRDFRGFKKIRFRSGGKNRYGYVPSSDLTRSGPSSQVVRTHYGPLASYSILQQKTKTFSTSDQVTYKTGDYESRNFNYGILMQRGARHFWRLYLGHRTIEYTGKATLNVNGAPAQDVFIRYSMLNFGGQMAWSIYSDFWYAGLGFEVNKALSGKARLGGQDLTGYSDLPDYLGGHVMSGIQYSFSRQIKSMAEFRWGLVPNQDPSVTVMELVFSLMYSPGD